MKEFLSNLPGPVKRLVYTGLGSSGILAAACTGTQTDGTLEVQPESTFFPATSTASAPFIPAEYDSERFLQFPFGQDPLMKVQQGWHGGIDYVKGDLEKF